MHHWKRLLCLILLISIPLVSAACGALNANDGEPEASAVPVQTLEVGRGDITRSLTFSGQTAPISRADVAAEVPGKVGTIGVSEGDIVAPGDWLMTLDSEHLRFQVEQAQSQLDAAQANLADAENAYAIARREVERLEPLYQQGVIAKQTWDHAQDDLKRAERAATASAPAAVAGAQAAVQAARQQAADARIYAPIGGEVAALPVAQGDQVGVGSHLITLIDPTQMEVVGLVSERQVMQISTEMSATITLKAAPDRTFSSTIAHVGSLAAPTGTGYPVKLRLDNPDGALRSGMAVTVTIEVERITDALLVPVDAVIDRDTLPAVFVFDFEDRVERRDVSLGLSDGTMVAITTGLEKQEHIVIAGQHFLTDGDRVQLSEPGGSS